MPQKDVKIKSYVRKGKIVKGHDRKIDLRSALIGGGVGALGVGALAGAYMLGKRGTVPKSHLDDIKDLLKNKQHIKVEAPSVTVNPPNINVVAPAYSESVARNIPVGATNNAIVNVGEEINITKIALPKKINKLSPRSIDRKTNEALNMSDDALEREISKYGARTERFQKTLTDVTNANLLTTYIDELGKSIKGKNKGGRYTQDYLRQEITKLRDYFKLPKVDVEDLKVNYTPEKEYYDKLRTLANRDKNILDIYQKELNKRIESRKPKVEIGADDESIERMRGLLDDFSKHNNLTHFSMGDLRPSSSKSFFLSDIAEFGRRLGSKDKQKRSNNLLRNTAIGIGSAALLGAGLYALNKSRKPNLSAVSQSVSNTTTEVKADNTIEQLKSRVESKLKPIKRIKSRSGFTSLNNVNRSTKKIKGTSRKSESFTAIANPNVTNNKRVRLNFSTSNSLVTFARKRGSKDKTKRMSRVGAALRIGIPSVLAVGTGALIGGNLTRNRTGALIGAGLMGGTLTGASYLEHKSSPYSPIGKKKWRNYPVEPKLYGVPVEKLSLIKGLDQ
ncbi:glycine zipper family protein [Scytonema sp. NUACC26]|uniref:glycine zipper family protein n=1 Tax=Scytonema sp. NUACC26 TaxID=3140176 RepID=UPI0034DBA3C8